MKRKEASQSREDSSPGNVRDDRQDHDLFKQALQSLTYPFLLIDARDYRVLLDNSAPALKPQETDTKCYSLTHRRNRPCSEDGESCPLEIIKDTKRPVVVKHVHYRNREPRYYEVHGYPVFDENHNVVSVIEYSLDITEREIAQNRQRFAAQMFDILNRSSVESDIIRQILLAIKEFTGFEAVGIRLREGDDYPYYVTFGFPSTFVARENFLCVRGAGGDAVRDEHGNAELECMCGNVIRGRTDPKQPFFTDGGSFWSNCTTELLATTSESDRQSRTRNVCNAEGYESVALIPLMSDTECIGLLQLNDRRKNQFTLDLIEYFESIGASVGIALARKQADEELRRAYDEMENRVKERTAELQEANENLLAEVAERKRTAEALTRTARALKVLSECNQALVRARTEDALLKDVCQLIVATGRYRLAWVGYAMTDSAKTVKPVCQAGFEEGYLENLNISWADIERGRGPTGTAIRTAKPSITKDILTDPTFAPWREQALKRGYSSSIALPLSAGGEVIGALNIYAAESDAFDEEEVDLLLELAGDLAFGIMSIRSEAGRLITERALDESQERYRTLVEGTDNLVAQIDPRGKIMFVNSAAEQLFGVAPDKCIGMPLFDFIHPADRKRTEVNLQKWIASEIHNTSFENRTLSTAGTASDMLWTVDLHYDKGGRLAFLTFIGRDFTERKKAEVALHYRLRFEELIASISTSFINLKVDDIDEGINRALKRIGEFAEVDRSYIFVFADGGEKMSNTHEWCQEGVAPMIDMLQNLNTCDFQWSMAQLKRFDAVYVPRVTELPAEAAPEKKIFEEQQIQSLMLVPMIYRGALLGFVGFDAVRHETTWDENSIGLLKIVGDMLISALVRSRAEKELRRVNDQLTMDRQLLQDKNIAMREVLARFEEEKQATREQITTNVEEALMPLLAQIKEQSDASQIAMVELLEQYLKDIASPFIDTLKTKFSKLTPRELEICNMIRSGRPSKQIARVLNVSLLTVHKHREQIRKKLGLKNTDINLNTYLQSLQE